MYRQSPNWTALEPEAQTTGIWGQFFCCFCRYAVDRAGFARNAQPVRSAVRNTNFHILLCGIIARMLLLLKLSFFIWNFAREHFDRFVPNKCAICSAVAQQLFGGEGTIGCALLRDPPGAASGRVISAAASSEYWHVSRWFARHNY